MYDKISESTWQTAIKLHKSGNLDKAEHICRTLLIQNPNLEHVNLLLGIIALQKNKIEEAIKLIQYELDINPYHTKALGILGLAYFKNGNFQLAKNNFLHAIDNKKDSPNLYYNLGQTLFKLAEYSFSIEAHHNALSINPNYTEALIGLAAALIETGDFLTANIYIAKAIAIQPGNPESHFMQGNILRNLGEHQMSIDAYLRALDLNPNYVQAIINCASAYKDIGLTQKAVSYYDRANEIDPLNKEALYNKSLILLSEGNFELGWSLYENRIISAHTNKKFGIHDFLINVDKWDGNILNGRLIVLPEQGIGDQIFFLGLINEVQNYTKFLTICADSRLLPLLKRTYKNIEFIENLDHIDIRKFDAQIHMGSLCQFFRASNEDMNNITNPYLLAEQSRTSVIRNEIKKQNKLICGISWISHNSEHGHLKSISLSSMRDALLIKGFDFVDLQYGDRTEERESFKKLSGVNIIKRSEIDNFNDIDGLASLIDACDLVLTVSNTTAHLACALGKPTLVLLPQSSAVFWYWHRKGMQSPWYPTAVLLRQEELGGWPQVVAAVRHILQGMQ